MTPPRSHRWGRSRRARSGNCPAAWPAQFCDFGEPFASIFARYNHDFYAVDPHLFSPAEIVFQNLDTGRSHHFGATEPGVLTRSFFS